jgi:hypothetical protein
MTEPPQHPDTVVGSAASCQRSRKLYRCTLLASAIAMPLLPVLTSDHPRAFTGYSPFTIDKALLR